MKEFFSLAVRFDLKGLMLNPTENTAIQAFRALFVGGVAFIADAGILWLLSLIGLHYLICAAISFIAGVAVNYILSGKFVFTAGSGLGKGGEVLIYVLVSLVGLGITEILLWVFTEKLGLFFMVSKCIAALIAFGWNFTARKLILYRKVAKK